MNERALKGIVVDAGHGGADPGASGNGIVEKDYNLMISNYMFERLKELGVPVKMTRTTDETLTPEERVKRILDAFGNDPNVLVISNHLNAGGGDGAEVVYALRNNDDLARDILNEMEKTGQNIRKWYQRRLDEQSEKDYYFIHRNTGVTEPVLVEYGFVDNVSDADLIKNKWKLLADATVKGVSLYKQIPYKMETIPGTYTVKAGDTLWSIAKQLNVGVEELKKTNNLVNNTIHVGMQLKIPGYVPPETSNVTYVVQSGDNLFSIAKIYNTTVEAVMKANDLTSINLHVGQTLKIPAPVTEPVYVEYIVKAGDSLYGIAQTYKTTVSELKVINKLTSDLLHIGQVVMVPSSSAVSTNTYVVQKGDTLWGIASKYYTTPSELKSLNNLPSDSLSIGQILIIP